ncbi:diguanylate cyclase [beta proteobacterium CB]|jgi:diguanylate cyclase (GGDEF)-like protein/PAS domain S-box-containing protein|nr:diguanylate cyclase [beta proteobacterium CB]
MAVHTDFKVEPLKFRIIFAASLISALAVIWSVYFVGIQYVQDSAIRALKQLVQSETVILEDHLSRTLDVVNARLRFVSAFTNKESLKDERLRGDRLYDLIQEDRVVRSLSLLDDQGKIVASSNPRNLGVAIPLSGLPDRGAKEGGSSFVSFGNVYEYRDIYEINSDAPSNSSLKFWLASMPVNIGGRVYHWIATVNLGLFENLWQRINESPNTEIAVYNYQGKRISAHHGEITESTRSFGAELLENVDRADLGFFESKLNPNLLVAYRSSSEHPAILAVVGDKSRLIATLSDDRKQAIFYALTGSLLVLALMAGLFRWYVSYEKSLTELANQITATGAHLMISESSRDGKILWANPLFLKTTGYQLSEIKGESHRIFNSGLYPRSFYDDMWSQISRGEIWSGTFRNRNKAGEFFWVKTTVIPFLDPWKKVSRYVALYSDITEAIRTSEQVDHERSLRKELSEKNRELAVDANTDPLTGVSNRRAFEEFRKTAIEQVRQKTQPISVLMLDLDQFKVVNDTYGHAVGDQVLQGVARRWSEQMRSSDILARMGGEEFTVLLPQTTMVQAELVAEKFRGVIDRTPIAIDLGGGKQLELHVTVSIGIASAERITGDADLDVMMVQADNALYQAKHNGRNQVMPYRS